MFFLFKASTTEILDAVATQFPDRLGDDLESLILHGPHADPSAHADDSTPVHLLIVLREVTGTSMERLAEAFDAVRGKQRISPMVMCRAEMEASTDVFPITFLEMKRCHRLLAGEDVLQSLEISPIHLRLRCEQELKNLVLRMQSTYLTLHEKPRQLIQTLRRNHASLVRTLGASLLLRDIERPDDGHEVLRLAAGTFGLDVEAIDRIGEFLGGSGGLDRRALSGISAAMIQWAAEAAAAIDTLPETVTVVDVFDGGEDGE